MAGKATGNSGGAEKSSRSTKRPARSKGRSGSNEVLDAEPTKELFIRMLVRDIELIPAIIDLVDNSVDGARRLRGTRGFEGLWVRVEATEHSFRIVDNCGGIPLSIAQEYAFRFGRPESVDPQVRSVGQFGVGMKRALFKLGTHFRIESRAPSESWTLDVDVEKWRKKRPWKFELESLERSKSRSADQGTVILVRPLHPAVARDFALESTLATLNSEIRLKHQESMNRGLAVSLNGVAIDVEPLQLLQSARLRPAYQELTYNGEGPPVVVKLYVGIARQAPGDAGWYVYCNGRLVLGPDQSKVTGWGSTGGTRIPRFHNQFSLFRGYVFFDCDDPGRLPWTTTKTGIDSNSEIYRSVLQHMVNAMRPVIDFLNFLDRDKELTAAQEQRRETLEREVEDAAPVDLPSVVSAERFTIPERIVRAVRAAPRTQSIQYRKPVDQINKAKKSLKASSAAQVGEKTFDYFYELECRE